MLARSLVVFLIIATVTVADIASDIYSPSLPTIAHYFGTHDGIVQLTISLNLIGIAISGLVYGPLSDHYGRRPVILVGMTIFSIFSILCCLATSIVSLIVMRFFQGLGAGVAGVVGYAALKDIYTGNAYARALSKLNMVVAFSPAVAPIIGSTVISYGVSWRVLFILISILSIIMLLFLYVKFKETIKTHARKEFSIIQVILQYYKILSKPRFIGFALIHGLTFAWLWAYIGNLPFIFTQGMGVDIKYYGYYVTMSVTSYTIGTMLNQRYVEKVGSKIMLMTGLILSIISETLVVMLHYSMNLTAILAEICWIPSNIGIALVISNNMSCALESIEESGTGSAFIFFVQMVFGAIGVYIAGYMYNGTVLPTALLCIICSAMGLILHYLLTRKTPQTIQ